jgi:hypothetical protein
MMKLGFLDQKGDPGKATTSNPVGVIFSGNDFGPVGGGSLYGRMKKSMWIWLTTGGLYQKKEIQGETYGAACCCCYLSITQNANVL